MTSIIDTILADRGAPRVEAAIERVAARFGYPSLNRPMPYTAARCGEFELTVWTGSDPTGALEVPSTAAGRWYWAASMVGSDGVNMGRVAWNIGTRMNYDQARTQAAAYAIRENLRFFNESRFDEVLALFADSGLTSLAQVVKELGGATRSAERIVWDVLNAGGYDPADRRS